MANKKITELTEETSPQGADLLALVDDVSGTPTTKKVTVTNLMTQAPVQAADISGLATQVSLGNHAALTSSVHGISAFGATLVDDADASAARTTLGLGTAATSASTDFSPADLATTSYTASGTPLSFTLTSAAKNKAVIVNESSNVYVTVPTGLGAGFNCTFVQLGSGKVVVQAGSGAVVGAYTPGTAALNTTAGQYAALHLVPTATDNYVVFGESTASPFINNYSILFDGTNDYVSTGTVSALNSATQFTISWWQKTSAIGDVIFSGNSNHRFQTLSAGIQVRIAGGATTLATVGSGAYSNGAWHQLTLTYNAGTVTLYADGSSTADGSNSNFATQIQSSAFNTFLFGQVANAYFFNGYLDEVAIWSTALSSSEIPDIQDGGGPIDLTSNNGNYTSSANLVHYWRGGDNDSGTGTTLTDLKGSLDGTLTNGASFSTEAP